VGARRTGREAALQMLFQVEAQGATADEAIRLFWRQFDIDPEGREYADAIVRGVTEAGAGLDEIIRKASSHWRVERMSRVDRNLLRLGAWELSASREVPRAVVLDEAVGLGVLAAWAAAIVHVSFALRARIGQRAWRALRTCAAGRDVVMLTGPAQPRASRTTTS